MEKQREWRVAVFPTPVSGVGCHFIIILFLLFAYLLNCHGETVVGFGTVPIVLVSIAISRSVILRDY